MSVTSLVDPPAPHGLGRRRGDVLDVLRAADTPVSAAEVADRTGMHVNTARFHLDGLVAQGLATRRSEAREAPGRPRILYRCTGPAPGSRSYQLLAEMLTGLVTSQDRPDAALETGRSWGRHLVERAAPSEQIAGGEATARLTRLLDAVGFGPAVAVAVDDETQVNLHHCPFREVAERHTDVVCAIHLGLMQGALAELRAPLEACSLDPFVRPELCVAHLRATAPAPA